MTLVLATGARAEEALDGVAAVVNDDIITLTELNDQVRMFEHQLQQQKVQLPPADVLRRQVLERMIVDRIQLQLATEQGIQVDDEALNTALNSIAKQNGLTLEQFREVLAKDGFDFADFREQLRNEIIIQRLRKRLVDERITVTEAEVKDLLARQASPAGVRGEEEYHIAHILITVPEGASPEQLGQASEKAQGVLEKLRQGADFQQTAIAVSEGQQALEGGDLGWRRAGQLPTLFVDAVNKMKPGEVSDIIRSPNGFHIIKLLEMRSSTTPQRVEQVLLRHIMIRGEGSDEDSQARLQEIKKSIASGEDFAELARTHSQDTNSAANGGTLGWVNLSELPPPFPDVVSRLEAGAVSDPFKTPYGWHLVQVMDRREGIDQGESRQVQAHQLLRARKIEEETQALLRRLRDEAYVEYRLDQAL
jgi:peptidyl-prolyl cis-trans isomerase SurA